LVFNLPGGSATFKKRKKGVPCDACRPNQVEDDIDADLVIARDDQRACYTWLFKLNVEYLPRNPVRRGLVKRAEEWKGSSVRDYARAALALLVTCH
jgi:hypothetical protein